MKCSVIALLLVAHGALACEPMAKGTSIAIPTEAGAIHAAKDAWQSMFSKDEIARFEPYHATMERDLWHVYGTLPPGTAGGTPEARVCMSDGYVPEIWHGK